MITNEELSNGVKNLIKKVTESKKGKIDLSSDEGCRLLY